MNWLEFFASVIGSLAWPSAITVVALMFRKQILSVFERAEELGFGDWKLKLNQDLEEAEEVARTLPPPPQPLQVVHLQEPPRFEKLLEISPNAAILDQWLEIESRLAQMGDRLGLPESEQRQFFKVTKALKSNPLFPDSLLDLLAELRQIRNLAAHKPKIPASEAYRFRDLTNEVLPFLRADLFNQN